MLFETLTETAAAAPIPELTGLGLAGWATFLLTRLVMPVVRAADAVSKHFEAEADHRKAEAEHWGREEAFFAKVSAEDGAPRHISDPATPILSQVYPDHA